MGKNKWEITSNPIIPFLVVKIDTIQNINKLVAKFNKLNT